MISSSVTNVFASQANPTPAKQTQAADQGTSSFDNLFMRELDERQNMAKISAQNDTSFAAAKDMNPDKSADASMPPLANNADSLNARTRQDHQRSLDNRAQQDASDRANRAAHSQNTKSEHPVDSTSARSATDDGLTQKSDSTTADKDANDATTAITDPASGTTTSAALQALVANLTPKNTVIASPALAAKESGEAISDPKSLAGRNAAIRAASTKGGDTGSDAAAAHDPAFDALLAQAAQSNQARSASSDSKLLTQESADAVVADAVTDRGAARLVQLQGAASSTSMAAAKTDIRTGTVVSIPGSLASPDIMAVMTSETNPGNAARTASATLPSSNLPGSNMLSPPLGSSAWDNALGQRVVWMAAGAEQSASLTLNPPDLGPVQVVINVSNAQADATFTAAQPEVRQALEAALPRLREMLADAGIALGQANVSAGTPNQNNFGSAPQTQSDSRRGSNDGQRTAKDIAPIGSVRTARITGGNGLVDTFA